MTPPTKLERLLRVLVAGLIACWAIQIIVAFARATKPLTAISELTRDVPLRFPGDAVLASGEERSGFGAYKIAHARFRRSEVHAFMAQPLLAGSGTDRHSEILDMSFPELRTVDWKLYGIRKYWAIDHVECDTRAPGNNQAYVLIDLDDSQVVNVYIDRQYH
ncbi:MAG TPA: hypothetical protein VGK19_25270 [Capsulimonadaceae bacterium]|jgi:hypothetical protein